MPNILMTRRALAAVTIALSLAATAAFAQQSGRIRGQIEKVDGAVFSVKTRDGNTVNVKLADKVNLRSLTKITLADVKTDSYIGIAGMSRRDGSIEAFSIHVLPAAARGNGKSGK